MDAFFRKLPMFKGKARLAKFLLKAKAAKEDVLVKGKYGCIYLLPSLVETIAFEIFINGIYEGGTNKFLCKKLSNQATFLDIGANIGSISIPLIKHRNDIKLICLEAAPWIVEYLEKNIDLNNISAVQVINKAVYNTDNIEMNFFSPKGKFGKGSLSPVFTKEAIPVKTITLDTLLFELGLASVDFIKIDIEGFEWFAFKGAKKILTSERAPDILFEFVDWAEKHAGLVPGSAQELLLDWGYKIYKIDSGGNVKPVAGLLKAGTELLFASKKEQ